MIDLTPFKKTDFVIFKFVMERLLERNRYRMYVDLPLVRHLQLFCLGRKRDITCVVIMCIWRHNNMYFNIFKKTDERESPQEA